MTTSGDGTAAGQVYPHAMDVFRRMDGLEALELMKQGKTPQTNLMQWMQFTLEHVEPLGVVHKSRIDGDEHT